MSKVFKRALLFLAVLLPLAGIVHADGLKLVTRDLPIRQLANGAILDSTFVSRASGIRNSAERADTTAAFSPLDWTLPGPYVSGASTAAGGDTISWLRVTVTPDGAITNSGDTLGVILQVSDDDQQTWTSVVWTGPAIDPDVASMGQAAILETGATNGYKLALRQAVGPPTTAGPFYGLNTAPTDKVIYGYRSLRFIFTGDHVGRYRCRMEGFQNEAGGSR